MHVQRGKMNLCWCPQMMVQRKWRIIIICRWEQVCESRIPTKNNILKLWWELCWCRCTVKVDCQQMAHALQMRTLWWRVSSANDNSEDVDDYMEHTSYHWGATQHRTYNRPNSSDSFDFRAANTFCWRLKIEEWRLKSLPGDHNKVYMQHGNESWDESRTFLHIKYFLHQLHQSMEK